MKVKSRLMLRGATVVPVLTLLIAGLLAPAAAAVDDVPSEQSMGEGSGGAVTTTLVLRPICTSDDMHRFAVVNDAGPATQFTVEVESTTAEPLAIGPGETVRFWVDAAHAGPVEITWPDGSASATPAGDACAPEAAPPAADPEPEEPVAAAPVAPSERDAQARPEEPVPPESAQPMVDPPSEPTAGPARDAAEPAAPNAAPPARDDTGHREPSAAPEDGDAAGAGRTTPRPRPSHSAFACPDHWMAVDSDGDGTISGADECELVVETGAAGGVPGALFTTVALIVTVGLLIASVVLGTLGRRRMSPR
jgi:hypothetical protein